jgi:hypothetical protein
LKNCNTLRKYYICLIIKIYNEKIAIITILLITNQFVKTAKTLPPGSVLLVAADARAAGLANKELRLLPMFFSQQWNPAKYAFALNKQDFYKLHTLFN